MSSRRSIGPAERFPLRQWPIPQIGSSPITGVTGTLFWGGINRPDRNSRWVIGDSDLDDAPNFFPQGVQLQQLPYTGPIIATLPATVIWMESAIINGNLFNYFLCEDGHIYEVSPTGVIIDVGGGFSAECDISDWQGTHVLFNDLSAGNLYAWDGGSLTTALSNQPARFITVYGDRVWLFNGTSITWTQGGTYNSLAGDAGSAVLTDASAASTILGAVAGLGVIIVFGASWIGTISNLQVTGSPAVLTFQFTVLSGQVGIGNKFCIIPAGNSFYFANSYGIWDLQGSAPILISPQLAGFFGLKLDMTRTSFSAAFVSLFQTPCLIWQAYYLGDTNVPAGYTLFGCTLVNNIPNQWFRVSQGDITYISSLQADVNNGMPQPFATDGRNVFRLFRGPDSYQAQIFFKIWDFNSKIAYKTFDYLFISTLLGRAATDTTITATVVNEYGLPVSFQPPPKTLNAVTGSWINSFGVQGDWINTALATGDWEGSLGQAYFPLQFGLSGTMRGLGINLTVFGAGTIIQSLIVGYRETTATRGP